MKTISILLLASLLLASCSKDDDPGVECKCSGQFSVLDAKKNLRTVYGEDVRCDTGEPELSKLESSGKYSYVIYNGCLADVTE